MKRDESQCNSERLSENVPNEFNRNRKRILQQTQFNIIQIKRRRPQKERFFHLNVSVLKQRIKIGFWHQHVGII